MAASLHIDSSSPQPIWSQIEEGLRRLVTSGSMAAGQAVPSVRDLARDLQINPATVSKAYQRLTDAGVLVVRRGEGTFVAAEPPALPQGERQRVLGSGADRYAGLALSLGASRREAVEHLQERWADLLDERKENR
ncbi:MAG: GntR family transcriptional regulator [Acidobacteriota bacterium]